MTKDFKLNPLFQKKTTWKDNLFNFLWGYFAFQLIGTIVQLIVTKTSLNTNQMNMTTNFVSYSVLFVVYLIYYLIKRGGLEAIKAGFKDTKSIFKALFIFIITSIVSSAYTIIMNMIFKDLTSNANQQAVDNIVTLFPVPSFFMVVIMAPICEELTYRGGIQTLIGRKNKIAGVIVTSIIFAFIHFDWSAILGYALNETGYTLEAIYVELINIPSYIIAGLGLGFAYQISGNISGTMVAHSLNNLLSYISILMGA